MMHNQKPKYSIPREDSTLFDPTTAGLANHRKIVSEYKKPI